MPTPLRYAARPAAALAAGLCLWLAFPDADLWFLAPVGVALLGAATLTAGGRRGAALGMLAGLAFFVPTLSWSGISFTASASSSRVCSSNAPEARSIRT